MTHDNEKITAIQAVVDRVESYQESAPEGTIEKELREGLTEVGVTVDDSDVAALVLAIESNKGPVDVKGVLG
ncbi:hypothetical protein GCM10027020_06770 [Nocardioides salsibiostraticola]